MFCFGFSRVCILGGSWLVISRVIGRVTLVITYIRGLITPLVTTHEPPSSLLSQDVKLIEAATS